MQLGRGAEVHFTPLYHPTDCPHMTLTYIPAINVFFTADLVYHKMFPWMGKGVERTHVHNWIHALRQLQQAYLPQLPSIYPGHGKPGEFHLLEDQVDFLNDFLSVVDQAPSEYEAVATLIRKYPDYYQREFILPSSVANFMKDDQPADKKDFRNVYTMRSSANDYRKTIGRRVL